MENKKSKLRLDASRCFKIQLFNIAMNQIEKDLLDFCKKVEIYIQSSSDYKGDIICGNFATRFYNLVRTDERAKDIIFHFDVLNYLVSSAQKEIEDFKEVADKMHDAAENLMPLHAGKKEYFDAKDKLAQSMKEYKSLYKKWQE